MLPVCASEKSGAMTNGRRRKCSKYPVCYEYMSQSECRITIAGSHCICYTGDFTLFPFIELRSFYFINTYFSQRIHLVG